MVGGGGGGFYPHKTEINWNYPLRRSWNFLRGFAMQAYTDFPVKPILLQWRASFAKKPTKEKGKRVNTILVTAIFAAKTVWRNGGLGPFLESPGNLFYADEIFNNFENDTMKLSVREAKLIGLWARTWATIQ